MSGADPAVTESAGGIYLNVHAQPGARRPEFRGMHGDALKIAIAEAAQDGKANAALVKAVAEACGVSSSSVEVVSGHKSRRKRLFVSGDAGALHQKISDWMVAATGKS